MAEEKTPNPEPQTTNHKQSDLDHAKKLIAEQEKTIGDYTNHLKRLQAEFENYMKRTQKEQQNIADAAVDRLLVKLLVVVDDFQHTLLHMKNAETTKEQVINGVDMIFTKMHKFLEEEGVRPIEANGQKFDPYKHEVILSEERDGVPENTVVEELQKGYLRKEHVIRYAKVKISKPKKTEQSKQEGK